MSSPTKLPTYADAVRDATRQYLIRVLKVTSGNRSAAAEIAGLHRTHFLRLLVVYDASGAVPVDPAKWRKAVKKPKRVHEQQHEQPTEQQRPTTTAPPQADDAQTRRETYALPAREADRFDHPAESEIDW